MNKLNSLAQAWEGQKCSGHADIYHMYNSHELSCEIREEKCVADKNIFNVVNNWLKIHH